MPEELVYDLWNNLNDLTNQEKYDYILNLANRLSKDGAKKFASDMKDELEFMCGKYNICPKCGSDLGDVLTEDIIHTELDYNNIEKISYLHCDNCGYDTRSQY